MRLFRAASLRAADAAAADAGVATTELMRRAGVAVADAALAGWPRASRVLIACGPGNNGGDGFVAAQRLAEAGLEVTVAELRPGAAKGDAAWARERLLASGASVTWWPTDAEAPPEALPVEAHDLVIDALFGTGLDSALRGPAVAWVEAIAGGGRPVLAVDVPSGIDADRARPPGPHVRADRTVQLAGAVPAALLAPARAAFGDWTVADIGIPDAILDAHADAHAVDSAWLRAHAPRRADEAHKYSVGTVLVVGGSRRYAGAPELTARGAYRAGAGLVTLVAPARAPAAWPEVVWEPPLQSEAPHACVARLMGDAAGARRAGAAVVGPGLEAEADEVARIVAALPGPLVMDAGALQPAVREAVHARAPDEHGRAVLTPHAGEAQRLLQALEAEQGNDASEPLEPRHEGQAEDADHDAGASIPEANRDPIAAALRLARAWNAVCVLKGAGTVIADADGRWTISAAGTPALATGGSGDVLAGVIAAFLAAAEMRASPASGDGSGTPDAWAASAAAVHLHGLAGSLAAAAGPGVIASDVAEALPAVRARHGERHGEGRGERRR